MAAGPAFRYGALTVIYGSAAFCVCLCLYGSRSNAGIHTLLQRMMFYCALYTYAALISFQIASAHNMTFCKAMYLLPCLDMCGFSLLLSEETLAADVREGGLWMKKNVNTVFRSGNKWHHGCFAAEPVREHYGADSYAGRLRRSFSWLPVTGLWDFKIICHIEEPCVSAGGSCPAKFILSAYRFCYFFCFPSLFP